MENHYMIDIEATGVDKEKDEILEVGLVEIKYIKPYWHPTGRKFHRILHYGGEPETVFAKEHMVDLYNTCNAQDDMVEYSSVSIDLKEFIHPEGIVNPIPKFFMGWNASNFDIPFMFAKYMLEPSYYVKVSETEEILKGDVNYRVYEQTGALNYVINMTGLDREAVKILANTLDPTGMELPEGKEHGAIYDCYKQIKMLNGLIKIGRLGFKV